MNDDLRAAAQAATPIYEKGREFPAGEALVLIKARDDFRVLASPDRILALLDQLDKAQRFIGGITADEWATIDKAREARAALAARSIFHDR